VMSSECLATLNLVATRQSHVKSRLQHVRPQRKPWRVQSAEKRDEFRVPCNTEFGGNAPEPCQVASAARATTKKTVVSPRVSSYPSS